MQNKIADNLETIHQRIKRACEENDRNPEEVKLLLATKTVESERIIKALNAGENLIAENRIQEVMEKYDALADYPHENHFIGHLQSNKVKFLIQHQIKCLHSMDRKRLANRLQNRLEFEDSHMDVLIQVNTSYEDSKFGVAPEKALEFTKYVAQKDRIHIKGLMTIGLFSAEKEKVVPCFRRLRELKDEINAAQIEGVEMSELSMGMSHDFEWAIAEGATIVRIGSAVFGERPYPDSYYWNEG
ncbi:MAG TPA: YggS family pyridoxal phosphate-dependent enzyme [Flavobacteriaceae bacterium]|nr:YggS family pyridoxal phosphate-dependent enzyme [Flavobacteriaceae bacterium]